MPQNGTSRRPLRQLKASACAKHFLAYSLENCYLLGDNCRFNFNANISQQELEDTYLPAFQAAVEVGGVSGLMCSENSVNDIPSWSAPPPPLPPHRVVCDVLSYY
jgi:beta-glucosidase-like glycosyl hydrolase